MRINENKGELPVPVKQAEKYLITKIKMKKFISATCIAAALLSGYSIYHTSNETNIDSIVLENIEALANGESGSTPSTTNSPTSSWFQYMDYTHPCGGHGMRMYCSKNGYSSSCTFHCGKKIS